MTDLEKRAKAFATAAHEAAGNRRKYTNEPYIVHPAEVAEIIRTVPGHTPEMIAAAWLHDVVEDAGITHETIVHEFGPEVGLLVWRLTDISRKGRDGIGSRKDGTDRSSRRALDLMHGMTGDWRSHTLKVADLLSNTRTIVACDPNFARKYLGEKANILDTLEFADPALKAVARVVIAEAWKILRAG